MITVLVTTELRSALPVIYKRDAHQLVRQEKRHATKSRPKAIKGGSVSRFSNFGKCRPEVADELLSGVAVDLSGRMSVQHVAGLG